MYTTHHIAYNFFTAWWRHQIETFSTLLASCKGNTPTTGGWIPLTKASDAELWYLLWSDKGWANYRDAGDLRRHRAHYDATVMHPKAVMALHRLRSSRVIYSKQKATQREWCMNKTRIYTYIFTKYFIKKNIKKTSEGGRPRSRPEQKSLKSESWENERLVLHFYQIWWF